MKKIQLTQGLVAMVDDRDYEDLSQFNWHALFQARWNACYAYRRIPKSERDENGFSEAMHRRILGLKYGDHRQADHINHDTLDNRRENLRIVNNRENSWNRKRNSPFGIGVYAHRKRFRAMISIDGRWRHVGVYDSPSEAQGAVAHILHRADPNASI